ncbi:uncharacterized protein LOC131246926 [Magnolia sinica]|uniref:uncharacterized protein LOC131246926 n=1 Tax=Magnolia sinica TaxID=86752 RepID=UPI002658F542|nr:uncharacterized protein LOC131246926 [Magnolia sinica]
MTRELPSLWWKQIGYHHCHQPVAGAFIRHTCAPLPLVKRQVEETIIPAQLREPTSHFSRSNCSPKQTGAFSYFAKNPRISSSPPQEHELQNPPISSETSEVTMSAFESLLHHACRHCFKPSPPSLSITNLGVFKRSLPLLSPQTPPSRFLLPAFSRPFSSPPSPPSDPQPEIQTVDPPKNPSPSSTIRPVSYPTKPIDTSSAEEPPTAPPPRRPRETAGRSAFRQSETDTEPATGAEPRPWSREDIRYVKDVPSISPTSYPARVAPLPEDRVVAEEAPKVEEEQKDSNELLEWERRRIEADFRLRRVLKPEEEVVPFPTLIKVEKKLPKAILDLQDAIKQVKANAKQKFVETVEAHVNLGVDPRRGDQMVRGAATLPHGTGKTVRVAVFAEGAAADEARAAGADIVGGDELIEEIKKGGGKLNFDKCISTPTFMPRLGKIARILGPRGMMPNPKLGSVTSDVAGAVQEAKRGRIDFKIDKTAIVHVGLGKVGFSEEALRENVAAFVNALLVAKPVGLKKTSKYAGYVKSFSLCSTMGPGFPVSIQSLSIAADNYSKQQQLK